MNEGLNKLTETLEALDKRVDSIDVSLAIQSHVSEEQERNLREHMKRWKVSEQRLDQLENNWMEHLNQIKGMIQLAKYIGLTVAAVHVILQVWDRIGVQ